MPGLAQLEFSGRVATLTLNRPEARNALSLELLADLHARVDELAEKSDVTVLVVTGAGRAFCAGMDLKAVLSPPSEGGAGEGIEGGRRDEVRSHSPPRQVETMKRARALRRASTGPEHAVWFLLRGKRAGGYKFRRQHPFGPYILDFYCREAGLVVELDGSTHLGAEAAAHDLSRTRYLAGHGLFVLRFSDDDAVRNTEGVVKRVVHVANERMRTLPQPLPPGGEPEGRSPALPLLMSLADFALKLRRLPMVTVARVNGAAIGGGCGLATVCDIAVTHADSKMGFPEVDLGVCPAVVAPWLVRKIGAGRARNVLLRGGLMTGQRAWELGIVDQLVPSLADLDAAVAETTGRLSTGGPAALRATKALLNDLDGSLDADLARRGAELSARVLETPEAQAMLRSKLGT